MKKIFGLILASIFFLSFSLFAFPVFAGGTDYTVTGYDSTTGTFTISSSIDPTGCSHVYLYQDTFPGGDLIHSAASPVCTSTTIQDDGFKFLGTYSNIFLNFVTTAEYASYDFNLPFLGSTPTPTLTPTPTPTPTSSILYHDTFDGAAGIALEVYNPSYSKYSGGDYMFLTGTHSIYTPEYSLEYYSGPYTTNQGIQFDLTTNFSQGEQQFGVEVFAQGPGTRADDLYLHIAPDGSGHTQNINGLYKAYFPAGYFTDNTTYTVFVSYDGLNAKMYLNGTLIYSFSENFSGYHTGSFGVQLMNNACIGNLYYADSLIPLSTGTPNYLTCSIPVPPQSPMVGLITASVNPIQVNTSTTATASFTDANTTNIHIATWDWGDGTTSNGTVTESSGSGFVSNSHTYTTAGVYEITLTVTDNANLSDQEVFQYLSVYNPTNQGLFSGASKFTTPQGSYPSNPSLSGQVKFGITAKYQNGIPVGNVSMNFKDANLEFEATSVTVLVTSNGKATLRGAGIINNQGNYTFLATGIDGADDTIRFQIKNGSTVVYDSQINQADTADPTASVTGQVIVH